MTETMIQKKKQEVVDNIAKYLKEQADYVFLVEVLSNGEAELLNILSETNDNYFSHAARALGAYNDILKLIRPIAVIEGQINE